eukprot:jgi/Bigna1/74852/fgenesh1_pg.31_\
MEGARAGMSVREHGSDLEEGGRSGEGRHDDVVEAADDEDEEEELSDAEEPRYSEMMKDLDHAYEEYRQRRNLPTRGRGRSSSSKLALDPDEIVPGEDEFNLLADTRTHFNPPTNDDDDDDDDDNSNNPLNVEIAEKKAVTEDSKTHAAARVSRWFSRDMFGMESEEEEEEDNDDDDDDDDVADRQPAAKRKKEGAKRKEKKDNDNDDDDDDDSKEEEVGAESHRSKGKAAAAAASTTASTTDEGGFSFGGSTTPYAAAGGKASSSGDKNGGVDDDDDDSGFEEVALEEEWSSDSDARAEALAMGALMLRKRSRNKMINDAYNRYSWNDTEDAPEWFRNEEAEYNVRILPVTREQVQEARAQLTAINAKPMKKVAEARYRKKVQAMKKMKKATQKAEGIMNDSSVPDGEKIKGIEKVIKNAAKRKKKDRIYVVSKRGIGGKEQTRQAIRSAKKKGGRVKLVDKRMRADTYRAKQRAKKGGGKKKGGGSRKRKR